MNRKDLQYLARLSLAEANALLAADLPDGAYYLAGYAIECALKACIAKTTRLPGEEECGRWLHTQFEDLIKVASMEVGRLEDANADPLFATTGISYSSGPSTAATAGRDRNWRGPFCKRSAIGNMG